MMEKLEKLSKTGWETGAGEAGPPSVVSEEQPRTDL